VSGANYWLAVGPIVFALAIAVWIVLVLQGARRRRKYPHVSEQPDRGDVAGGRIHADTGQVNTRDESPRRG
jgi:hypothetical protein